MRNALVQLEAMAHSATPGNTHASVLTARPVSHAAWGVRRFMSARRIADSPGESRVTAPFAAPTMRSSAKWRKERVAVRATTVSGRSAACGPASRPTTIAAISASAVTSSSRSHRLTAQVSATGTRARDLWTHVRMTISPARSGTNNSAKPDR